MEFSLEQPLPAPAQWSLSRVERRNLKVGLIFISPWIIGFAVFTLYPILISLYYSFTDFSVFQAPHWVGLENYVKLFTRDDKFFISLYNTVFFFLLVLPASVIVALFLALLLNTRLRGTTFFRSVFFLPTIVPPVASAALWMWILNPQWGLLNLALRALGVHGPPWFSDPDWAKPSLVLMALWTIGTDVVVYLAALQDIPRDYYEAALVDGANAFQRAIYITIPLLSPAILFHLINGTIWAFQYFTQAFVISNDGGPGNSTLFYSIYLYRNAFRFAKMGYASAQAWILFLVVLAATLVILGLSRKLVHYER
jgi:multiple sugar transport system permease protein